MKILNTAPYKNKFRYVSFLFFFKKGDKRLEKRSDSVR